RKPLSRSPLTLALAAALLASSGTAVAQSATTQQSDDQDNSAQEVTDIDKVVVTGSLIPQSEVETFVPLTVITAEDSQTRGHTNMAEVLQKSSLATGAVQGSQTSASFTQGAETVSLFGLPPGYV